MSFLSPVAPHGFKVPLLLSALTTLAQALDFDFCASLNTASMSPNFSIYQSNGLCKDFCAVKKSAFAITKGKECWCSDFVPAHDNRVDKGSCGQACPGFPDEKCGGSQAFGYVSMGIAPSGTKGGNHQPEPTSTSKAEMAMATATITRTVQDTVIPSAASRSSGSLSSQTEETTSSNADKSSIRETAVATSVVQTVTAGGIIQTVTIIPSQSSSASDAVQTETRPEKNELGTGGVVGIAVSIIAAVLAMSAMALLYFQRKNRHGDYRDDPSVRGSSSGILGGRADMSGVPGSPGSTGNRSSMLHIDPRMDPFKQGLYVRSGSHESINTLRDDHDYSRRIQQPKVLRAMNPDPTDD